MGNSSERSYLLVRPNIFTVWAGVPSSQRGRTSLSVSHTPSVIIFLQLSMKIISALLILSPLLYRLIYF